MSCKFESIVENCSCDVAPGVGTQAANCEAPERTSPSSWRIHVLSRENINLVPVETFSWNKTSQFDDLGQVKTFSWYKTPFTASLVMSIDTDVNMRPASVGTRSLRCWLNSLAGHPPTTVHEMVTPYQMPYPAMDVRVRPGTGLSTHNTILRLYVRQPDGWFCVFIVCKTLTIKRLR